MKNLTQLLRALDPGAELADRHVWLIKLFEWIRGDKASVQAAVARVQAFIEAVQKQPELQARLQAWWETLIQTVDITPLLADFGFAPRTAFVSELAERLRRKLLPGTPETRDASELFPLVVPTRFDAQWISALEETQMAQLTVLLSANPARDTRRWHYSLMDAITYCTAQIRATGFAPELRLRMNRASPHARSFHALPADVQELRTVFFQPRRDDAALQAAVRQYRERLDACRQAVNSIYAHLEENGISVGMVFRLRQLRARMLRDRELLDALLSPKPAMAALKLLARRVATAQESKSIGALISTNSTLLSAKMAERSAETGEHYITRNRAEYKEMLGKAMGGGAVTALTTLLKFMVVGIGLSAFWSGFWASVAYAGSFILIQLLHFTLATKQPAMTAPAMAAKLKDIDSDESVTTLEDFVDEVTHLVRSQVAAVFGNVFMVVPAVLLVNAVIGLLLGRPMISHDSAHHVLESLTLLGPTLLWAAFTGVVLFASSMIAGWVENWFVLHHLGSAMRHNPRFTAVLGNERAARWSAFTREHISGFASNISLGFMLGLIPAFTGFFGLELELRHVTLSTGQLAAAGASLGLEALRQAAFWWSVASIPLIGALNLGVSFYFAFRLALQAHNVSKLDRARIRAAILARWRSHPLHFFIPR
ncbi:site-specific recombinase [Polaromonas naphthalenivorans]|uniref:Putative site-specific recombinase transmembrane protein n=1 Tax=Polaromonas naphthalenivorans (strain CJ2) TaxID=365044 RepID=A1VTI0_POLNA|nr:site-specific recombinase [Polaromonas naphthalenivorans]ABM38958.1 putative site-specific recombinase transmembrane protein [Polaromonas naphthalenivorans CJ2]